MNNSYDEEIFFMEGYYDALCEELNVELRYKKKNKTLNGKKLETRKKQYENYKAKRKKEGKEVLSFNDWCDKIEFAKDVKKDLKKAGVKVAITAGTAVAGTAIAKKTTKENMKNAGLNYNNPEDRKKYHNSKKRDWTITIGSKARKI